MSRFFWLVRREIWEHKAIWVAPLIVLGCLVLFTVTGNVHLGPIGTVEPDARFGDFTPEVQARVLMIAYAGLALVMDMVLGIVAFFYALDSLYADRRDRSVLFWKSLPLSDAETVLAKFTVAAIVIPVVALVGAVLAQFVLAAGGSAKLALSGLSAAVMWNPQALLGGIAGAVLWCLAAMLWYAPVIGYLMLASAWAPKGPFLWAVVPPAAIVLLERVLLYSSHAGDFIANRLFGVYRLMQPGGGPEVDPKSDAEVGDALRKLTEYDFLAGVRDFFTSAELWLGVLVAGLLVAAAIWLRRYRDETA